MDGDVTYLVQDLGKPLAELFGLQRGRVELRELRLALSGGAGPCDEAHLDAGLTVPSAGELRDIARAELRVCRKGDPSEGFEEG